MQWLLPLPSKSTWGDCRVKGENRAISSGENGASWLRASEGSGNGGAELDLICLKSIKSLSLGWMIWPDMWSKVSPFSLVTISESSRILASSTRLLTNVLASSSRILTWSLQEERELEEPKDSIETVGRREDSLVGGVWGSVGTAAMQLNRESETVMLARVCDGVEGRRSTMEICPTLVSPAHIHRQLEDSQSTGKPMDPHVNWRGREYSMYTYYIMVHLTKWSWKSVLFKLLTI